MVNYMTALLSHKILTDSLHFDIVFRPFSLLVAEIYLGEYNDQRFVFGKYFYLISVYSIEYDKYIVHSYPPMQTWIQKKQNIAIAL